jgi:hypothetical protein
MTWKGECPAPATGWGMREAPVQQQEVSMAREVAQSFYLMGLYAVSLGVFLGLGLMAIWLLG